MKGCMNRCMIFPRCMNRCTNSAWISFPDFSIVLSRFEFGHRGEQIHALFIHLLMHLGKKSCTYSCTLSCTREKVQIRKFMHLFMRRSNFQIRKSQAGIHTGFTARDSSRDELGSSRHVQLTVSWSVDGDNSSLSQSGTSHVARLSL